MQSYLKNVQLYFLNFSQNLLILFFYSQNSEEI